MPHSPLVATTEETTVPITAPTNTIDFGHHDLLLSDFVLSGQVTFDRARQLLTISEPTGDSEVLNMDATAEGYVCFPDELVIKDWSEHSGLTSALVDAGIVMRTETIAVGPFDSRAYRVVVLDPEVAR